MMDVFYCRMKECDPLRKAIALPCLLRWQMICEPIIIEPPSGMCGKQFQSWRRWKAETEAKTKFYILADDDCMPLGGNFLERCEAMMEKYPQYALLGTEEFCAPYVKTEVYDTATGGGINVIRKGIIEVPPYRGEVWDGCAQGQHIRSKGFKVGRMRDVRRNHYGEGMSTVWPDGYRSTDTKFAYLNHEGYMV